MTGFKQELSLMSVLLLATLGSCAVNPETKDVTANANSINSEQSKVVDVKLREAWEEKRRGLNKQSKDYPLEKVAALESLLGQVPEEEVKKEFERIASSPVGYSDLNEYEQTFVQALVSRNVSAQDRSAVVALLSAKAPEFIGAEPIVIYLSYSSIPDPLLVLFESYNRTTNANTKKDLLSILGHAFRNLREKLTGDDEFVVQSKQWYLQNHAQFELNPYYYPGAHFPTQQDLFIDKSKRQPR